MMNPQARCLKQCKQDITLPLSVVFFAQDSTKWWVRSPMGGASVRSCGNFCTSCVGHRDVTGSLAMDVTVFEHLAAKNSCATGCCPVRPSFRVVPMDASHRAQARRYQEGRWAHLPRKTQAGSPVTLKFAGIQDWCRRWSLRLSSAAD